MLLDFLPSNSMKNISFLAVTAAFAVPLVTSAPVRAAAEYCHTDYDGDYVCIHAVYGPRENRGITASINGSIDNIRVNCYNRNYQSSSLVAYACWSYTAIAVEPAEFSEKATKDVSSAFSSVGFASKEFIIDVDKATQAMPPEMK